MSDLDSPAIVLFIYNRPEVTRQVFEAIRGARPRRLFVMADAPSSTKPDDAVKTEAARKATEDVDWPCELCRDYASVHLGIKRRVESGLSRVFCEVEESIVLEDDCLPHPTFFPFTGEMLRRYRDDGRVMSVCGSRLTPPRAGRHESYAFSQHPFLWGWATWRRAWRLYDGTMEAWARLRDTTWLSDRLTDRYAAAYWAYQFDAELQAAETGNWDVAWSCASWVHEGLSIIPSMNLVTNLGFRADATHTRDTHHRLSALPTHPMAFPLVHPTSVSSASDEDRLAATHVFSGNLERLMGELRRRTLAAR